jgi:hypothetical protein
MIRRLLALLLVGVLGLAGLALAQEPPAKEEPPVRLKKKKPRGEDKPKVQPDKDKAEKKEDKKPEPREAEPVTQQEEEKEVLQRVVKNVHHVGERLAKNDLGEATQQTQRDILKDLDSLIQRNDNPPQGGGAQDQNQGEGGGGGADQDNQNQQNGGGQQDQNQQGGKSGQKPRGGKGSGGSKNQGKSNGGGTQSGSKPGSGSQSTSKPRLDKDKGKPGGEKNGEGSDKGGKGGKNGNGGGGGRKDDPLRNRAADQYKHDVWGHLPQTLRAQMDAYSNPQPFMSKYDDVIKQYYRTIAEQGRRKGE